MQEQRNEIKGILDEISDIIHLDVFSTEDVDQKLDSADKKRLLRNLQVFIRISYSISELFLQILDFPLFRFFLFNRQISI
ncbi:hypothetical protein AVM03_03960 [Bacillus amyloliquefaciens]|nr:hypothetical protein AVM03_03960 [Bacillus amyloliquefaciens]